MSTQLQFNSNSRELELMSQIADRAIAFAHEMGYDWYRKEDLMMDLNAFHTNAYKLDLEGLLAADLGDFGHDVFGINKYIDHDTGKTTECFVPRYALGER
jgi:hypothetical protein